MELLRVDSNHHIAESKSGALPFGYEALSKLNISKHNPKYPPTMSTDKGRHTISATPNPFSSHNLLVLFIMTITRQKANIDTPINIAIPRFLLIFFPFICSIVHRLYIVKFDQNPVFNGICFITRSLYT